MNDTPAPSHIGVSGPPCEVCERQTYWYAPGGDVWCAVCQWWAQIAERGREATNELAKALGASRKDRKRAGLA